MRRACGMPYVYILASHSRRLYIGVTSDLAKRTWQHKHAVTKGFAEKYHADRLVYFEQTSSMIGAIAREKEMKRWSRERKLRLIERHNPGWNDLSVAWFEAPQATRNGK